MPFFNLNPLTQTIRQVAIGSVLLLPTIAIAQQNGTIQLAPINVTAQKYTNISESGTAYTIPTENTATGMALNSREIPQATTVVTNQRMLDQDVKSLRDAVELSTGVTAQDQDAGRTAYAARGFEINSYSVDGQHVNFDKQYSNGEDMASSALFDHIEVVRGASDLANGSGNPSAHINLVRKHADSKTRKTILSAEYGSWKTYRLTADHSQPLNTDGSIRIRGIIDHQSGDSYIDLEHRRNTTLYGTIGIDITPQDQLNAGITYQDYRRKSVMWGGLPVFFSDGTLTNFPINTTTSANWVHWDSKRKNFFVDFTHTFENGWKAKVSASHDRNDSNLENVYWFGNVIDRKTGTGPMAAARKYDVLWRKQNNFQVKLTGEFEAFGQTHDFVTGFDYSGNTTYGEMFRGKPEKMPNIFSWTGKSFPRPKFSPKSGVLKDLNETETALYAATNLHMTDDLALLLGTRISSWKVKGSEFFTQIDDKESAVWSPYVGVVYNLNDQHSIYASYTGSFQPQSNFKQTQKGEVLHPLLGKNYEVGLKSGWMDGKLTSQISLFYTKQKNFPIQEGNVLKSRNPAYYPVDATSKGFEIELNGELTPGWQIGAGYSQYKITDKSGKELNTEYPRNNLKLFTTYDASDLLPGLTLGGGIRWIGNKYRDIPHIMPGKMGPKKYTRVQQDSVAVVDLMAKYQIQQGLSAQLNIKNAFNKKYYSQVGMYDQNNYAAPRSIHANIRYDF